jgi:hypothetical protein
MALVKSFTEACKVLNIDPATVLPDVSAYPQSHQNAVTAAAKLFIVVDALNDGWKPDWNDNDQEKYFAWFDLEKVKNNPSGFRLNDVYCDYSHSYVGSRLCFKDRDTAEHAAKHFIDLYRNLMIL